MKPDPSKNLVNYGPFTDRLSIWAWRGFLVGCWASYLDIVFLTQSVNLTTNVARFLYITPPVTALPMAYITSREVLGAQFGHDKIWPYFFSGLAPGAIWGAFRKHFRSGVFAFGIFGIGGLIMKANEDMSGTMWNLDIDNGDQSFFKRNKSFDTFNKRHTFESWHEADPGPYWKEFVDEKQDPFKDTKL